MVDDCNECGKNLGSKLIKSNWGQGDGRIRCSKCGRVLEIEKKTKLKRLRYFLRQWVGV